MLINIFRFVFVILILAVVLVNISSDTISGEPGRADFWVIIWSGLSLVTAALVIDICTPKKSLSALAGVFFGLLVGIFMSWALALVLDMLNEIYRINWSETALLTIKMMMGISICYLIISIVISVFYRF